MSKFFIESKAGVIFGVYEGGNAAEAFAAMVADGGDAQGAAGTLADWTVLQVTGVDQDWDHEATIYTLSNGAVYVESGPSRTCYRSMDEAREALAE